jgi:hypothetical protein
MRSYLEKPFKKNSTSGVAPGVDRVSSSPSTTGKKKKKDWKCHSSSGAALQVQCRVQTSDPQKIFLVGILETTPTKIKLILS